jgi:hypothetical protein
LFQCRFGIHTLVPRNFFPDTFPNCLPAAHAQERNESKVMDDEPTNLSMSEVRRALDRLRPADIVRLSELARNWARGLRGRDADDMLNEAFDRVLSGRRPWPSDVSTPAFFSGVMRSIASQWRREGARESLIEDGEEGATENISGGLGPDLELNGCPSLIIAVSNYFGLLFGRVRCFGVGPWARRAALMALKKLERDGAR